MSMLMPHVIDVSAIERKPKEMMPGIITIESMTTLTGEQRSMMDGIVTETRKHGGMAPGLPHGAGEPNVSELSVSHMEPVVRQGSQVVGRVEKVKPTATKSALGMRHIRGTKY